MTEGSSFIIEFCGLPGSGKSYVADLVFHALTGKGIRASLEMEQVDPSVATFVRVGRKLRLMGAQILARPAHSLHVVGRVVRSAQCDPSDALSTSVQWLVSQRLLAGARRTGGVHLFDEGVVQALWSIGLRGHVEGVLRLLNEGGSWIAPDLVVVVEAPVGVVEERLATRKTRHSRTQRLANEEQGEELREGEALLGDLMDWWRASVSGSSSRVVQICNGGDELALPEVARVAASIESLRRP